MVVWLGRTVSKVNVYSDSSRSAVIVSNGLSYGLIYCVSNDNIFVKVVPENLLSTF